MTTLQRKVQWVCSSATPIQSTRQRVIVEYADGPKRYNLLTDEEKIWTELFRHEMLCLMRFYMYKPYQSF